MKWEGSFRSGKELVLATSSKKGIPHTNIVISLGFVDGKLLVADCQMDRTIKNLKGNKNISVVGGYFRINGRIKIFSSGKYFDVCKQKNKKYTVKHAILINIDEVFNLDKLEIVI